jgi:indole-3-glycerol phosphate synthase
VPFPHPGFWNKCLFELSNLNLFFGNLKLYPDFAQQKFVYNSRDLRSGLPKKMDELDIFMKEKVWTCQASGIRNKNDIRMGVDAYIVGEHLVNFCREDRHLDWGL